MLGGRLGNASGGVSSVHVHSFAVEGGKDPQSPSPDWGISQSLRRQAPPLRRLLLSALDILTRDTETLFVLVSALGLVAAACPGLNENWWCIECSAWTTSENFLKFLVKTPHPGFPRPPTASLLCFAQRLRSRILCGSKFNSAPDWHHRSHTRSQLPSSLTLRVSFPSPLTPSLSRVRSSLNLTLFLGHGCHLWEP